MKRIVSRENAHFRELRKLCQGGRERRKTGCIVLDGMHLIEAHVERFGLPQEIVVSESGLERDEIARFLAGVAVDSSVTALADALFGELAVVDTPSGIMAVATLPGCSASLKPDADTLVLDGVQDPGNLGSILRSAAAAGFRQVALSPDCAQAWSPKVLRAAMGGHFFLDIHEGCDLLAFLSGFRGESIVTALDAVDALYALDLAGPVAWVFGSEGQGVRPEVMEAAGRKIRIPMPGKAESLNVAAAAAICLFETVRQRSR